MGPDAMILVFWMLNFKPTFSLSSFTFIKRLFSSSLSAISVVSSAYPSWLMFLPAILIPTCASSSPGFLMMSSVYILWCKGRPGIPGVHGGHKKSDTTERLNWTELNSAYKLNKQGDKYTALMYSFPDLEPVCYSMSSSNCCFLTCIQISQEASQFWAFWALLY